MIISMKYAPQLDWYTYISTSGSNGCISFKIIRTFLTRIAQGQVYLTISKIQNKRRPNLYYLKEYSTLFIYL